MADTEGAPCCFRELKLHESIQEAQNIGKLFCTVKYAKAGAIVESKGTQIKPPNP